MCFIFSHSPAHHVKGKLYNNMQHIENQNIKIQKRNKIKQKQTNKQTKNKNKTK